MCLIIAKPKGTPIKEDLWLSIENAQRVNSHGMGYMYKLDGEDEIYISKGFFTTDKIIEEIDEMGLKPEDELVVHLRMATHGKTNVDNCHPFVVSSNHKEVLSNGKYVNKPCIAHNGVISMFGRAGSDYSDTYHFVKDFLSNLDSPELIKHPKRLERYKKTLEGIMRYNRFAVLSPDRDLRIYGSTFIQSNGYWYSNGGYRSYDRRDAAASRSSYTYSRVGKTYARSLGRDEDEYYPD